MKGLQDRSRRPRSFRKSSLDPMIRELILKVRLENPTYGKAKITIILARDHGWKLSESTVGRVLKTLMDQGKVEKYRAAVRKKQKRKFNTHATRWKYGMKAQALGEMIQIDHMTVHRNGVNIKHFQAWDPISKMIIAEAFSTATSTQGARFLDKVLQELPFQVKSIQVDGGSEFMKDFEKKCQDLKLPLYVLPPKRPQ